VTEREAEELLRETMRDHADRIDGTDTGGLLRHGRRRLAVRRGVAVAFATIATMAVAIGVVAAIGDHPAAPSIDVAGPTTVTMGNFTAPPGWVPRSSLGLQIAVPQDWTLNDFGCHQSAAPSFVNSIGGLLCFTPEPPTKQIALISGGPDGDYTKMTTMDGSLGGVPITVTRGTLPDGRYAGLLAIPSRGLDLSVRTLDRATRETILASARLVDVDYLGCPTKRPSPDPTGAPTSAIIRDDNPATVTVCHYNKGLGVLQGSAALDDRQRSMLVRGLLASEPGRNPDAPKNMCMDVVPPAPDAVLLLGDGAGHISRLWVTFEGCSQRGVDNGAMQVYVSKSMVTNFMSPLRTTYGFTGDLQP
jgi:hypothetical protein